MLSQKNIKLIKSLQRKKFRQKYNLFVVEGNKSLQEIVKSKFEIQQIYSIDSLEGIETELISPQELKKISSLQNPQDVLAVVQIPETKTPEYQINTLLLEDLQDPGNLGTIIRTADWFGIKQIIASPNSVDVYNPKVIQASMGSFTRVHIIYQEIAEFMTQFQGSLYSADMHGVSIYTMKKKYPFALVMGNEGNGLSQEIINQTEVVSIPNFSPKNRAESLNVSIATSVLISEFIGHSEN